VDGFNVGRLSKSRPRDGSFQSRRGPRTGRPRRSLWDPLSPQLSARGCELKRAYFVAAFDAQTGKRLAAQTCLGVSLPGTEDAATVVLDRGAQAAPVGTAIGAEGRNSADGASVEEAPGNQRIAEVSGRGPEGCTPLRRSCLGRRRACRATGHRRDRLPPRDCRANPLPWLSGPCLQPTEARK